MPRSLSAHPTKKKAATEVAAVKLKMKMKTKC
jgi:hypothetical protein